MAEDNEGGFDLSRRKVLGGIMTVGAASAATGAGTMAWFSDSESSTGNTVNAGTIDLKVNDADIDGQSITVGDNVAPGWEQSHGLTLSNEGSLTGDLYIKFGIGEDSTGLENYLNLTYTLDGSDNSVALTDAANAGWVKIGTLGSGESKSGSLGLKLPEETGNGAQGKTATIDVSMKLEQQQS